MNTAIRELARKGAALSSGPIARGSMVSVGIRVTGLVLSFAQAIVAARLLGVTGYGLVAVALAVAQIGSKFALFGYGTLAVREVAAWLATGKQFLVKPFLRQSVVIVIWVSMICAAMIWIVTTFASQALAEYASVLRVSALIIPVLALIQLFRGVAQGFGQVSNAQVPGEVLRPAMLLVMIGISLAILPQLTAPAFLVLFAIAGFGAVIVGGFFVRKHPSTKSIAPPNAGHPAWFRESVPFFGLSLIAILQGEFATLMLALFSSVEQAGLYQPIARLTPIIALPASAAAMRYAPRISEFWSSDQMPRLVAVTRTYTAVTSGLTVIATLVLAGLGPWILAAFGSDFVGVASLLWIVGAAQIINTACGPVDDLLAMTNHAKIATISKIAGLVSALIAAALLIPAQGTLGAAISVSFGLLVWNIISLIAVRRLLGFDPSLLPFLLPKPTSTGFQK